MPWFPIRHATADDHARLNDSARRFAKRHRLHVPEPNPVWNETWSDNLDCYLSAGCEPAISSGADGRVLYREDILYLRRLWRACAKRALQHPAATDIAYGTVGYGLPH